MPIKWTTWGEKGKILKKHNLPKLNQEEIEKLNKPTTNMEIENCNKKSSTNKSPGSHGFTDEFYQKFRKELTSILPKLFKKIAEEGKLPNSFYDTKTRQRYHTHKKKVTGQYH